VLRVKGLGDLEAEVVERIWTLDRPLTVRDVLADLNTSRDLAYTTVMTVMDNLHRKGWLVREMVSRAYVYTPTTTREQYSAQLMESALSASSDSNATLVHFVQAMSAEELQALQQALAAAQAVTPPTLTPPATNASAPTRAAPAARVSGRKGARR
jgi:predicted transcriptional regulator